MRISDLSSDVCSSYLGLIKPSDVLDEPGIFLSIKGGKSYFTAVGALTEPAPTLSRSALTTNYRASHASLLEIIFELLAANVVEYVKYFAEREQLHVSSEERRVGRECVSVCRYR